MSNNKILVAGLLGGVTAFILGFLVYGLALKGFYDSHMVEGVAKADEEMVWWALIVGNLAWGLLYAVIYGRWASISTFVTGAKAGAVIGALIALTYNLNGYATANMMDLTAALADVVVSAVVSAIIGGVVAWWLGRK
ncbi:MAG: hypothetical protein EPO28_10415 [Saprospiraceae bacterium]|nr:MAG: hypothetical protein EPO28_10415 [Saprospiraceae bacterium]